MENTAREMTYGEKENMRTLEEKNIGDKVWWATCGQKQITIDCPVCFRKKKVVLILGNGEQIETPCEYCVSGFEEPKGFTNEYQLVSEVKEIAITGKEVREDENGRRIEYRFQNYCLDDTNIFNTKEDAENRVKELIKIHEDSEVERNAYKKKKNQTHFSWSVGYHRKRLKDAQREIDYNSRKITELLTPNTQ